MEDRENTEISRKLVIVGDGYCGKTSLLIAFKDRKFPQIYVPTVFDDHSTKIQVDGKTINFYLWDTAGQEEYERLRPLTYPDANVVLICFTVDNRSSLSNVELQWLPEVQHYTNNIPILLVACKKDLRKDVATLKKLSQNNASIITPEEGYDVSKRINAYKYMECSAKYMDNVIELFEEAVRATLDSTQEDARYSDREVSKCCVLL